MDRRRYPRLAAYLDALPARTESYPECVVRGSATRAALLDRPLGSAAAAGLPGVLASIAEAPPLPMVWIPEAHAMALALAIGDHHGMSDDGFLDWVHALNRALLGGPTYRYLMSGDAADVLRHARLRWTAMHRGVKLERDGAGDRSSRFRLAYPSRLYDELLLKAFARTFQATLELSAAGAEVVLTAFTDHGAVFDARWR